MIIQCISDLHGNYPKLVGGDLLIVAGDLTAKHTFNEYAFEFITWISKQEYKRKVVIAGNHDTFLGTGAENAMNPFCDYLCDSGTEFEGLKIWGSPWTKTFEGMNPFCKSFTVDTEEELEEKWALIPNDIDILITHSPPYGIMDGIPCKHDGTFYHAGSHSLIYHSQMRQPKLHVFGHIHEGYGVKHDITTFVNASYVNEKYQPVNKPVLIGL